MCIALVARGAVLRLNSNRERHAPRTALVPLLAGADAGAVRAG